jgi:hypothetical protein
MGISLVLILWGGSLYYLAVCRQDLSWTDKGNIGNAFTTVSALFAGLAFVAIVISMHLQSRALRQTKSDIDLQNFENRFFQLIGVYNTILEGIEKYQTVGNHPILVKGRQRFRQLHDEFVSAYNAEKQKTSNGGSAETIRRHNICGPPAVCRS